MDLAPPGSFWSAAHLGLGDTKKKNGPFEVCLEGPVRTDSVMVPDPRYPPRRCATASCEPRVTRLVRRTFRNEDELDAAVFLLRALLRGGLARARRAARRVDALLTQVGLGQVRAALRQLRGLRLLRIGVANDDHFGGGVVLQAQGHVVSDALAEVVEARNARLGVAALADLGSLRRRWRLLYVNVPLCIGLITAGVGFRAIYLVAARLQTRRVIRRGRTV